MMFFASTKSAANFPNRPGMRETVGSSCTQKYEVTAKSSSRDSPTRDILDKADECLITSFCKFSEESKI